MGHQHARDAEDERKKEKRKKERKLESNFL